MLNRTQAPEFKGVEHINFLRVQKNELDNGIPVFVLNGGDQNLVRVEFIFGNVNWDAEKPLLSQITNSMLNEGTAKLNSADIANQIDFYGAYFQTEFGLDRSTVTLYSLNKYLENTLPIVQDVLTNSIFPQKELNNFLNNQKQRLKVSLEKKDYLARKRFNELMFGKTLYGYSASLEDYDTVKREDLMVHFKKQYHPQNCTLVVSGKFDETALMALLNQLFGNWESEAHFTPNQFHINKIEPVFDITEKENALQSAIRLGVQTVNRTHPDFVGLLLLNTVLGGYFGSRLMNNIREDKGYTYGIGSGNICLENVGYLTIGSEVGVDVCKATFQEIEKEINILRTQPVPDSELEVVKNFFLGSVLGSLENIFSHADKFKSIYFYGLDYTYFDNYIEKIKNITAEDLMHLANKYLDYDKLVKVVVGKFG
ncbi:M16 family metallopeptidase [Pseudopedobacter beijingensis]|uniref:M16 family metallopeptidase n=1 Tax=Pseudopedobacter beijingensis TaxID=1207056 RepID=A0ABW4IF30_9SPHI